MIRFYCEKGFFFFCSLVGLCAAKLRKYCFQIWLKKLPPSWYEHHKNTKLPSLTLLVSNLTPEWGRNLPFSRFVCLCVNILPSSDVLSSTPSAVVWSLQQPFAELYTDSQTLKRYQQPINEAKIFFFFFWKNEKHFLPKIHLHHFLYLHLLPACTGKVREVTDGGGGALLPRSSFNLISSLEVSEPTQTLGRWIVSLKYLICSIKKLLHEGYRCCERLNFLRGVITEVCFFSWLPLTSCMPREDRCIDKNNRGGG